jgi:hypothetical protein
VLDRWLNGSLTDLAVLDSDLTAIDITKLTTTPVQWLGGQTGTATVSIQVLSPIEQWRQQHFGNTADPDNDGMPNLLDGALA